MFTTPSSKLWFTFHVVFPLLPFTIEAGLRSALASCVSLDTLSASNLAMSVGLLAIFVSQSLANSKLPLRSGPRADRIRLRMLWLLIGAMVSFALFGTLVATGIWGKDADSIRIFVIFLLTPVLVVTACRTQQEFKLKAVI